MPILFRWWLPLFACVLAGCGVNISAGITAAQGYGELTNPKLITILGYNDHAMEPSLGRDGTYLLFNNSNDPRA